MIDIRFFTSILFFSRLPVTIQILLSFELVELTDSGQVSVKSKLRHQERGRYFMSFGCRTFVVRPLFALLFVIFLLELLSVRLWPLLILFFSVFCFLVHLTSPFVSALSLLTNKSRHLCVANFLPPLAFPIKTFFSIDRRLLDRARPSPLPKALHLSTIDVRCIDPPIPHSSCL